MNLNRFVYPRSSFALLLSLDIFQLIRGLSSRGKHSRYNTRSETFFKTTTQPLLATNTKSFEKRNRHTAADSRLMTWCAMMKFPFIFWVNNGMSCGAQRLVTSRLVNRAYLRAEQETSVIRTSARAGELHLIPKQPVRIWDSMAIRSSRGFWTSHQDKATQAA